METTRRIAISLGVAAVVAIVCAGAYQQSLILWWEVASGAWRRTELYAVSFDGLLFWRSSRVLLWFGAAFLLATAYCYHRLRTRGRIPFPLASAVLSVVLACGATAILLGIAFQNSPARMSRVELAEFVLAEVMLTSPVVFLAGLLAGAWLARRGLFRSLGRLISAAALVGAVAGAAVLTFLARSSTPPPDWKAHLAIALIGAILGIICGDLIALALRRRLIEPAHPSDSPA